MAMVRIIYDGLDLVCRGDGVHEKSIFERGRREGGEEKFLHGSTFFFPRKMGGGQTKTVR